MYHTTYNVKHKYLLLKRLAMTYNNKNKYIFETIKTYTTRN